jgi:osmotically-inducible protein OsmY
MSVMYPLAIVNTASITSLVRMTLYHHSISVCHTKIETNEGVAALGGMARSVAAESPVARLVSDIPGVRTARNQMAMEEVKSK